jgi:hypothetical protein
MKKQQKGPAKFPPKNAVFEARRAAVALTTERDKAIQALRHSNAVAVYLLKLVDEFTQPQMGTVKIPLADYKKLLEDDDATIAITYEGEEAVVRAGVQP